MCGIAGIVSPEGGLAGGAEVSTMCNAMVHRGPDDAGVYHSQDGRAALGMRRLSIIDVSGGHQPLSNEDGTIWVVQNGEIYNFRQLRDDLERRGHRFASNTDTEVIVHLYEEYGENCVDHLRGMFAFAVWDERRRRLLLCRDRIGIKPLYYGWFAGRLVFASELKALLGLPEVERHINLTSLRHLLTFLTTPRGDSIIAGARKLEPAHRLSLTLSQSGPELRCERYWDLDFVPEPQSAAVWTERLAEALHESVRLHMISDVPIGAFLSGGVDSSAVVAHMAELGATPPRTFSIGFDDPRYDERPHARRVAQALGTEHHELVLEPDVVEHLEDIAWHLDEPFGDASAIPTYMVSRLAADSVKVVLSGDGGDELFAGYDKYRVERVERMVGRIPSSVRRIGGRVARHLPPGALGRRFLMHHAMNGPARIFDAQTFFTDEDLRGLLHPDLVELVGATAPWRSEAQWLRGSHWLSSLQSLDIHTYLHLDILTKVDRMSMAHSLEVRVPLLDHHVVELAARIPPQLQMSRGRSKHLFKQTVRNRLPKEIVARPKRGFAVPLDGWFRGKLDGFVRDLLLSERCRNRGLLRPQGVERLLQLHAAGHNRDLQLWTLISLEMWCRLFLDKPAIAAMAPAGASMATAGART